MDEKNTATPEADLELLDDLIRRAYQTLLPKIEKTVDLGDFLKMLDTRRKLTPENLEKKELWNLLKKIRNESMKDHPLTTSKQSPRGRTAAPAA